MALCYVDSIMSTRAMCYSIDRSVDLDAPKLVCQAIVYWSGEFIFIVLVGSRLDLISHFFFFLPCVVTNDAIDPLFIVGAWMRLNVSMRAHSSIPFLSIMSLCPSIRTLPVC